jgi:hypothetical protein
MFAKGEKGNSRNFVQTDVRTGNACYRIFITSSFEFKNAVLRELRDSGVVEDEIDSEVEKVRGFAEVQGNRLPEVFVREGFAGVGFQVLLEIKRPFAVFKRKMGHQLPRFEFRGVVWGD